MDPNQQQLLLTSGGAKDKTYIDEVFNTYTYIGNGTERTITTGIDLAGEGGLLWFKNRDNSNQANYLNDTTALPQTSSPWYSYPMFSNATTARGASANGLKSFNSDGFTIQTDTHCNGNGNKQVAWSFRKAPGFFDIVSYSGDGTTRDIPHNLGSVPGMIILKRTDSTSHWWVYHRNLGRATTDWAKVCQLDQVAAQIDSQTVLGATSHQNASTFRVGNGNSMNSTGGSYVAYLFAGGESAAATARSVTFNGSGNLSIASSSDFTYGTGDFTVECWLNPDTNSGSLYFLNHGNDNFSMGIQQNKWFYYNGTAGQHFSNSTAQIGQWTHFALARSSGTSKIFINGLEEKSFTDSHNYSSDQATYIGSYSSGTNPWDGRISNIRILKGTALYTSSFKPSTEPLTNITNTKLLCCNNSSTTGSTVSPGTITATGSPTASTDSPFDDPEGYNFGEGGNGNVVKCGVYKGSNTSEPEINLGWEPQLVMFKQKSGSGNWSMFDNVRGMNMPLEEHYLYPNLENSEYTAERLEITQQGFRIDATAGTLLNSNTEDYIYLAIRRSDGYVGKPPEVGTDAFAMDVGNGANPGPTFDPSGSTFKVGMRLLKDPNGTGNWFIGTRKRDHRQLHTNSNGSEVTGTYTDFTYPMGEGNTWNSSYQAWMWKRHAGFDVASYVGNNVNQRQIMHNMGIPPEMIWIKDTTSAYNWMVWHKDLTSGRHLVLNSTAAESTSNTPGLGIVSATSFNIGSYVAVNQGPDHEYVAYLFSSVAGISKVGTYTGDGTASQTITTGFQPRFLFVKSTAGSGWYVVDTFRGWGSGNDKSLQFQEVNEQANSAIGAPTASGFTIEGGLNNNAEKWIYYAHA